MTSINRETNVRHLEIKKLKRSRITSFNFVGINYPPDLQDSAVQTVLQQAEVLSAEWTRAV